jgi:hypothetical protein
MGSRDPQIVEKRGKSLLDRRFLWCSCGFDAPSPEKRFGLEPSTACDPRDDREYRECAGPAKGTWEEWVLDYQASQ